MSKSVRIPDRSYEQADELRQQGYESLTNVLAVAIDRLYQQEVVMSNIGSTRSNNQITHNFILHQGDLPGELRVTNQKKWYVTKQTWEGSRILDTTVVFSSMDESEVRSKFAELYS